MYSQQASGLAPDAVTMRGGGIAASDPHWQLRPETIESLFYLWRATGDERHRERGWAIFQAIEARCRVPGGGYAGLRDTVSAGAASKGYDAGQLDGTQPSWFLAETLKYLFLLFADSSALDLEVWVLNTEAHPFRVVPPAARAAPGSPLAGSLLQGLEASALVPGAPLPRGLRDGPPPAVPGGFAHDLPAGEAEEAWIADAWRATAKPAAVAV
jgi:mannosyl-oligosaccharide alpha-1,2-mannosidase